MPVHYEPGILQEHLATRRYGGIFDVSHMGRFVIKGRDRMAFLQHVLTNNAQALLPWQSHYTIIPTETGGAVDDSFLYRFGEEDYLLVVNAANLAKDWAHFQEQAKSFGEVILEDWSAKLAMLALQGPLSGKVLEKIVSGGFWPEPQQNGLAQVTISGTEVWLSRTGYTGEPLSFELFPPAGKAVEIWEAIYQAGREEGVVPVGLGARDTLRLEAAMPLYGHELGQDLEGKEIPIFAIALSPVAVSFSPLKGEFIGKKALQEQFKALEGLRKCGPASPPLAKRIKPLAVTDRGIIRQGHEVFLGDRKVGVVTSGAPVPYWQLEGQGAEARVLDQTGMRSLALAYLEGDLLPETELEVEVRKRRLKTRLVKFHGRSDAPPFFRPMPAGWEKPKREAVAGTGLAKMEVVLKKALDNHRWRQTQCINLIPSEQTPSPLVRLLSVSDPVCRYAEHRRLIAAFLQDVFYYQGTGFIEWVENSLISEMAAFMGADQVEVRPISGQMANMTVFSAMVDWLNRANRKKEPARMRLVMTNHIRRGGHLSAQPMGALRDYVAKDPVTERFAVVNFPVLADNPYRIDLEETARLLEGCDPELVVFGKSMVIHKEPVAQVKEILASLGKEPILLYDMAHVLGLIGPHFQEPFKEGAHLVTGSTHKTFFGTQRGVVGGSFEESPPGKELWQTIRRRAFPGMVSNHHLGTLLGQLAAAIEMNTFKEAYQPQVIANAKAFARALKEQGLTVEGDPELGYTETHQVIVRVGYAQGIEAANDLEANNIVCNYQALPMDESFTASSGLRLGVSEMTRFGMKEADFGTLAGLMAAVIKEGRSVKEEVAKLRRGFLELGYCFPQKDLASFREELLKTF